MVSSRTLIQSLATVPFLALAQNIIPDCNPLKATDCPADKALGTSFADDFSSASEWWSSIYPDDDRITYGSDGVELTLAKRLDNPALKSNFYIMFGKLEVSLKAAPGRGVVSSFYLQSDDLDEIDLEWVGSDTTEVQTNFFSKGDVTTYDRGAFHPVSQPQEQFHTYTIDWTKDEITFYVDGNLVRTITSDNPQGYPQSPMYVVMGIWSGGDPSNQPGTIEWAGGLTDYSQAPFSMYVNKVIISDYSTGKEYKYTDQTGSWSSIEAVDGKVYGRESQGEQDFETLVNGGQVDNSNFDSSSSSSGSRSSSSSGSSSSSEKTSSESSSESSSSSSSKSSSSSSKPSSTNSEKSSSDSHSSSESSSSRSSTSTVHSSNSSSLASRSSDSSRTSRTSSSSASLSSTERSSSVIVTSTTSTSSTQETSSRGITTTSRGNSESISSPASSSATTVVTSANSGYSLNLHIGVSGFKALLVSICLTIGFVLF